MKNQRVKHFANLLAVVLVVACVPSAPAQTFKRVKVKGGASIREVASGGVSVWARADNGNPYVLKGKQFVLANNVSLNSIAVGGGSKFQADEVWGLDSPAGNIYRATKSGSSWTFSHIPGVLWQIAVGPGYQDRCHPYEVWGLNFSTQIFRYNFCGKNFEQVSGSLALLKVGGDGIWGVNAHGAIFRFNFATGGFVQLPGKLTNLTVGPNGFWGLFADQIYQFYDDIQNFAQLPGSLIWIQAGGDGVWGVDAFDQLFRLEPSTSTFVQVPGKFFYVSVGSGPGVWAVGFAHDVYAFSAP